VEFLGVVAEVEVLGVDGWVVGEFLFGEGALGGGDGGGCVEMGVDDGGGELNNYWVSDK